MCRVVVDVDGGGAASDVVVALVDGDIETTAWLPEEIKIVCSRSTSRSSTWRRAG